MYIPSWKRHEKGLESKDTRTALDSADAFDSERKKELKSSRVAREWEKGRKEQIAKDKPLAVRKRTSKDPSLETLRKLTDGGSYDSGVIPSPGYVLVQLDPIENEQISGYYLPQAQNDTSNTGTVIAIGNPNMTLTGVEIPFAFNIGDKVIVRKAPYLDITVKGEHMNLMHFEDVLGRIL